MFSTPIKTFFLSIVVFGLMIFLFACNSAGSLDKGTWQPLFYETPEKATLKSDLATLDISNTDQGYLGVKYLGQNQKVKLQLTKDTDTYTYTLLKRNNFEIFPFSSGSGTYTIGIFENIGENQYIQVCAETVEVHLKDENLPFLYPNEYVNYTSGDPIIDLSSQITESSNDELSMVQNIFQYVTAHIDYDYAFAEQVPADYIPDISEVLESRKGICFDYASVMSAMLRIRGIPAKLVVGYAGDIYHAWISVYTSEKGWLEGIIQFDGKDWTMLDPTTAASSGQVDDITRDSRYNALYFY